MNRTFDTGATRDSDENKHDLEGFLSPLVLKRFAEYMTEHRKQDDGTLRDTDNWQRGIPKAVYMKSAFRHFMTWWEYHRDTGPEESWWQQAREETLCALLFNVMGYLHELLSEQKGTLYGKSK